MFTGLKAKTHFGRPNFEQILKQVSDKHPGVSTYLIVLFYNGARYLALIGSGQANKSPNSEK